MLFQRVRMTPKILRSLKRLAHLHSASTQAVLPAPQPVFIDADGYPHIIDLIFEYAPLQSLLALRPVCKSWNERATRQIGYHLRIENGEQCTVVHPGLVSEGKFCFTADDYRRAQLEYWPFAAYAHVLDFAGPLLTNDAEILLLYWQVKWVNTFRFLSSHVDAHVRLSQYKPGRVVYFDYGNDGGRRSGLDVFDAEKLVVHLKGPSGRLNSRGSEIMLHTAKWLREVIIVLHPWTSELVEDTDHDAVWLEEKAMRESLGTLLSLVRDCRSENLNVTVVGLEGLTCDALGLEAGSFAGRAVEEAVSAYIKTMYPPHDPPRTPFNYSLTFMGLGQYRTFIGEYYFQIEMEEKLSPKALHRAESVLYAGDGEDAES